MLYPATHSVVQLDSGNTEIVLGSLLNTEPRVSIVVEELGGRSLEQVVNEFVAGYEGFDIERTPLTVGGEAAVQLDRIPGQDYYRKVLVARDGALYQLSVAPSDSSLASFALAERLYQVVIDSFRFISRSQEQISGPTAHSGPPICPDLPRPAMVFQADNDIYQNEERYSALWSSIESRYNDRLDPVILHEGHRKKHSSRL